MKTDPKMKCECGNMIGLSFYDNRWWCTDCLWERGNEVAELKQRNKRLSEVAIKQIDDFAEERKSLITKIENREEQITEMAQRLDAFGREARQ